jgi:hypothetical protein
MFLIDLLAKLNAAANASLDTHFNAVVTIGLTLCAACMIIVIV